MPTSSLIEGSRVRTVSCPRGGARGTLSWTTLQSKGPWRWEELIATCPLSGASRIGLDRGTPSTARYLEEGLGQGVGDARHAMMKVYPSVRLTRQKCPA